MAPEIILEGKLNYAAMDDLKAIDIWALGNDVIQYYQS